MASSSITGSKRKDEVTSAFDEIARSASTCASKLMKKPSYDVFINHRGPDVKKTLATVLYGILTDMGLSVFLDSEELQYGDFLPATLEAAMRSASLHIAIFSENFAQSPWCLAQLSFLLKSSATIIPIYYHVEPIDLRYINQGKGMYADAFKQHEKHHRYSQEKLQEWREALYNVTFYSGHIIKTTDDEMRVLENIRKFVPKLIKNVPLVVAKHPVGLQEIVQDFEMNTLQSAQSDEIVQIVGIWGMGGCGKTTLAKELYNKISSSVERSSFLFDVRDAAAKGVLHNKQIKLINDLGGQGVAIDNIEEGKGILVRRLRRVRVLIVLDDVDHVEQLDALLPAIDSLEKGSLIIVTTRDRDVLGSWGISLIYKMRALDPLYAKQLFCWHAFLQPSPQNGFEELVENFLEACQGLPLSLKVFGGLLYGKSSKEYWESLLHNIWRILPDDIKEKLKISYDALNDEEKEMFLDTACFFLGETNSLAIEVWKGSGWNGLCGWERLLNKCLVEQDDNNLICMHNHLRDLGRELANQHSPSRFCLPRKIINAEKQRKKRNHIRGIKAVPTGIGGWKSYAEEFVADISGGILLLARSLVGLELLVIRGDYLNQVIGEVSRQLVWLRWFQLGQKNLPRQLSLKNLRVLELCEDYGGEHHLEELWEADSEAPVRLRELVISDCHKFQRFPSSIGRLKQLKKIVIISGNNVRSLPQEFCRLQSLENLQLCGCVMLLSLPSCFGDLRNLHHLELSNCKNLRRLPVSFKNLMLLQYLNLQGCGQLIITSEDFQNITKLEYLSVSLCEQLEELPRHVTNQASLRELYLDGVKKLRELPINIGQLSRLRKMRIGSDLLTSVPDSLGDLSSLTDLSIQDCPDLESLPTSFGDMSSLTDLSIQDCPSLESLPASLGDLFSLTNLIIKNCPTLRILPDSFKQLTHLEELNLSGCEMLSSLPAGFGNLINLRHINLGYCRQLRALPDSLEELIHLKELNLSYCEMLSTLPAGLGNLVSLRNINLKSCIQLSTLPDSFNQLTHLENLNLLHCQVLSSLPTGLGSLISLQNVNLKFCIQLSTLPADIKQNLQVSYDALDEEEREMFLDVACFLIGEKKSRAMAVWDGSGWNGLHGLETLVNKCLVELVDDADYKGGKIIRMHDHVRDMGREIASRHSPYRLWHPEQIVNTKEHSTERTLLRGILPADAFVAFKGHTHQLMEESSRPSKRFRFSSTGLQILSVEGNEFTKEFASLSEDLVWLRWEGFPLRNLPSWLTLGNLRVLELHGANELEELWEDKKHAPLLLRELIVTGTWSTSFERFPSSISYLTDLKKISLLGDVGKEFGIRGLPEEFCDLQSLEHLELRHCALLSSLPARFGDLRNLRHLDLCSCKALWMLPISFQQLTLLNYLDLSGCKRLLLQEDILKNITELKNLYLSGCLALQKMPHQIINQACLRELQLQHTSLEDLPSNIGQLSKLEVLTIGSPLLESLPDSLGFLSSLKSLSITDCFALESLPNTLGHLVVLEHLCIEATGVRSLPEGFRQLANLRTLKISDCPLRELDFGSMSGFSLVKLTEINLSETLVTRISISEHCCPRLETLWLSKNDYLEEIETLPATVNNIELSECGTLKNIKGIRALPILPNLATSDCPKELEKPLEF